MVGLRKKCSKEEVIYLLVTQNQHLKQFSTANNNINEHIEIYDIKPTHAKESVFKYLLLWVKCCGKDWEISEIN